MKGIWFGNLHSYADFNLILSKVEIPPATPKTNFIDIPGGDGSLDLTEALSEVKFSDRICKFTFTAFPTDDFEEKKRIVSGQINGIRCEIIVDKDPDYHWTGRCQIDEYASDKNIHQIVVAATVAPYKLKNEMTKIVVPSGIDVVRNLRNGRKTAIPTITTTAPATIIFGGNTYTVNAGTHKILNIELVNGNNPVTVTSLENVAFTYQEGDL